MGLFKLAYRLPSAESTSEGSRAEQSQFVRFIQTLDQTPAVSYMLDDQCRFVYTNPAWDRLQD